MADLSPDDLKALRTALEHIAEILDGAEARTALEEKRQETTGYPAQRLTRQR